MAACAKQLLIVQKIHGKPKEIGKVSVLKNLIFYCVQKMTYLAQKGHENDGAEVEFVASIAAALTVSTQRTGDEDPNNRPQPGLEVNKVGHVSPSKTEKGAAVRKCSVS
jgi:hypothetical protein